VTGDDIVAAGISGGEVGNALNMLSRAVTLGEVPNEKDALLRLAKAK
jgi:hypothetical protein